MPYISIIIALASTLPFRCYDRGCCFSRKIPDLTDKEANLYDEKKRKVYEKFIEEHPGTLKRDKMDYVKLHAGPEFYLHTFYAKVLLIIFVTFTYGLMMPILFPICAFTLANMYLVDTLMLTYFYRKPPLYDENVTLKAL